MDGSRGSSPRVPNYIGSAAAMLDGQGVTSDSHSAEKRAEASKKCWLVDHLMLGHLGFITPADAWRGTGLEKG